MLPLVELEPDVDELVEVLVELEVEELVELEVDELVDVLEVMFPEVEVLVETLPELDVVLVIVPELVVVVLVIVPELVDVELPPVEVEVELPLTSMSMLGVPLVVVVVVVVLDGVPEVLLPELVVVVDTLTLPPLEPPPKNPPKNPPEPPKPPEPPITIGVLLPPPQQAIGAGAAICGRGIGIGTIAASSGSAGISRAACRERGRGIARVCGAARRGAALTDLTDL